MTSETEAVKCARENEYGFAPNIVVEIELDPIIRGKLATNMYARDLHAALCRPHLKEWTHEGVRMLTQCSFSTDRAAARLAGIRGEDAPGWLMMAPRRPGDITEEVDEDLRRLGWRHLPWNRRARLAQWVFGLIEDRPQFSTSFKAWVADRIR